MVHPDLVPDFARRLASTLGLPFLEVIRKMRENRQGVIIGRDRLRCGWTGCGHAACTRTR